MSLLASLVMSGDQSEAGRLAYFTVGANTLPLPAGQAYPPQPCTQVVDLARATPGWAGCVASNRTRVYVVVQALSVWHAVRAREPASRPQNACKAARPLTVPADAPARARRATSRGASARWRAGARR